MVSAASCVIHNVSPSNTAHQRTNAAPRASRAAVPLEQTEAGAEQEAAQRHHGRRPLHLMDHRDRHGPSTYGVRMHVCVMFGPFPCHCQTEVPSSSRNTSYVNVPTGLFALLDVIFIAVNGGHTLGFAFVLLVPSINYVVFPVVQGRNSRRLKLYDRNTKLKTATTLWTRGWAPEKSRLRK